MTLDENRGDLERHADDFRKRTGFTYMLDRPSGDIVGLRLHLSGSGQRARRARALVGPGQSRRPARSVVAQRRRLDRRGVADPQRRVRRATRLGVLRPPRDGRSEMAERAPVANAYHFFPRAHARAREAAPVSTTRPSRSDRGLTRRRQPTVRRTSSATPDSACRCSTASAPHPPPSRQGRGRESRSLPPPNHYGCPAPPAACCANVRPITASV